MYKREAICAICDGTGETPVPGTTERRECRFCGGQGTVPLNKENGMANGFDLVADCRFGNQSNGKSSSIGVKCARDDVDHEDVERMFCGSQLEVELRCDPNARDDTDGQGTLVDGDLVFHGTGEVGHYSAHPDSYGFRLSFPRAGIDVATLARFAGAKGQIKCNYVRSASNADSDSETEPELVTG